MQIAVSGSMSSKPSKFPPWRSLFVCLTDLPRRQSIFSFRHFLVRWDGAHCQVIGTLVVLDAGFRSLFKYCSLPVAIVATIRPHQSAVVVHLRQAVVTLNTPVTSRVSDRREHRSIGQTKDRPSCWLLCGTAVSMRAGGVSQMEL